ncbi:MAG: hypothetical protein NZ518_00105 [Dehalococcoidia bacterium]|nr:hypothetical protein [Dehalococcoidia bacterium]
MAIPLIAGRLAMPVVRKGAQKIIAGLAGGAMVADAAREGAREMGGAEGALRGALAEAAGLGGAGLAVRAARTLIGMTPVGRAASIAGQIGSGIAGYLAGRAAGRAAFGPPAAAAAAPAIAGAQSEEGWPSVVVEDRPQPRQTSAPSRSLGTLRVGSGPERVMTREEADRLAAQLPTVPDEAFRAPPLGSLMRAITGRVPALGEGAEVMRGIQRIRSDREAGPNMDQARVMAARAESAARSAYERVMGRLADPSTAEGQLYRQLLTGPRVPSARRALADLVSQQMATAATAADLAARSYGGLAGGLVEGALQGRQQDRFELDEAGQIYRVRGAVAEPVMTPEGRVLRRPLQPADRGRGRVVTDEAGMMWMVWEDGSMQPLGLRSAQQGVLDRQLVRDAVGEVLAGRDIGEVLGAIGQVQQALGGRAQGRQGDVADEAVMMSQRGYVPVARDARTGATVYAPRGREQDRSLWVTVER